jgi:glycosyltransferase involved in cell wall biosynthesis
VRSIRPVSLNGRHVVLFNWRDTANPEGGGSERYVETMARGLVARGARATVFCAAHDGVPADDVVAGVRFVRRGSKLTVYAQGLSHLLTRRLGRVDAVVDVQNGLPFFTRLATRRPVLVLVHHVHREQWPVVYPGLVGRVGWFIESRLSPWLYRGCQYVTVSRATREELVGLGVRRRDVAVVHNGTDQPATTGTQRALRPTLCVVGRLVPHKQVEHAIDAVVALRAAYPDLELRVVGSGWWDEPLRKYAAERGVADLVRFYGHVTEADKHRLVAESWLQVLPSLKEGWGLVVGEAGMHGVPTVAYRRAGGTRESIDDGRSGVLVDTPAELVKAVDRLLADDAELRMLGAGARVHADSFTWEHSQGAFATITHRVLSGRRTGVEDPEDEAV